ncbi:hypothetical protein HK100_008393 [Physocladia obscura]|uniref:Uncharacterized protein n=1 Tax=Physocladia obscura TaxID=109957 RepID=A0AAD5T498_9FUNG|nr:hypothetical protein HK100_008393 [Physocladia obscura]
MEGAQFLVPSNLSPHTYTHELSSAVEDITNFERDNNTLGAQIFQNMSEATFSELSPLPPVKTPNMRKSNETGLEFLSTSEDLESNQVKDENTIVPQNSTNESMAEYSQIYTVENETGSEISYGILVWRIWLAIQILALSTMIGFNAYGIAADAIPCDTTVHLFAIGSTGVMAAQLLISIILMSTLPTPPLGSGLRMTWSVHSK